MVAFCTMLVGKGRHDMMPLPISFQCRHQLLTSLSLQEGTFCKSIACSINTSTSIPNIPPPIQKVLFHTDNTSADISIPARRGKCSLSEAVPNAALTISHASRRRVGRPGIKHQIATQRTPTVPIQTQKYRNQTSNCSYQYKHKHTGNTKIDGGKDHLKFEQEGPVQAGHAGHPGFKLIPTIQDKRLMVMRNS